VNAVPGRALWLCVVAGAVQANSQYSPFDQIDRGNVSKLPLAWSYRTGEIERRGEALAAIQSFQDTPSLIDGALIVCTPLARIIALDPETGAERWAFDPNAVARPEHAVGPKCRGVAEWLDADAAEGAPCRRRILFGTWDFRAWAIDARTGRPCAGFGEGGRVDLDPGMPLVLEREIEIGTPPAIIGDLAVFGSMLVDGVRHDAPSGKVRALDARTGAIRWQVALGTLEKLLPVPLPVALGTPNAGGPLATAGGLTFIGASLDDRLRAFDTGSGEILWETELPAGGQATPMTYMAGGRQYVVIAAGGHGFLGGTRGDYVLAFALPD
jgi:glucose dehydrogenase